MTGAIVRWVCVMAALAQSLACYVPPQTKPFTTVRYRVAGDSENAGIAYITGNDGRVVSISEGVVVEIRDYGPKHVGLAVIVAHGQIGRWVHYDYLAEVRVRTGDAIVRGETIGWAVRPGHVHGLAPGTRWIGRVAVDVCEAPCDVRGAADDYLTVCMRQALPGDVIFPVVC